MNISNNIGALGFLDYKVNLNGFGIINIHGLWHVKTEFKK